MPAYMAHGQVAWAMGEDLSWTAARAIREQVCLNLDFACCEWEMWLPEV